MNMELKPINDRRKCYGCRHLLSEQDGSGGTTFKCGRTPDLVLGYVSAFENDEPHEIDGCYERTQPSIFTLASGESVTFNFPGMLCELWTIHGRAGPHHSVQYARSTDWPSRSSWMVPTARGIAVSALDRPRLRSRTMLGTPQAAGAGCNHQTGR